MRIKLKLYATLADYLPAGARDNQIDLEVDAGADIQTIITRYNLPPKLTHLVLVNGSYVAPAARATHALQDGDQLAIWPPIAGG